MWCRRSVDCRETVVGVCPRTRSRRDSRLVITRDALRLSSATTKEQTMRGTTRRRRALLGLLIRYCPGVPVQPHPEAVAPTMTLSRMMELRSRPVSGEGAIAGPAICRFQTRERGGFSAPLWTGVDGCHPSSPAVCSLSPIGCIWRPAGPGSTWASTPNTSAINSSVTTSAGGPLS